MCFIKEWKVNDLVDPTYVTILSVDTSMDRVMKTLHESKQDQGKLNLSAMAAIKTTAKINIHNAVVTEALKRSAYKERIRLNEITDIGLFPSDAVVITDPYSFYKSAYLKSLPEERVWVGLDARLNGLVLAFQLKDFSCFVKYSMTRVPQKQTPPGHGLMYRVKSRPNFDHHQCWVYELPKQAD
jgi:hypothetical protein